MPGVLRPEVPVMGGDVVDFARLIVGVAAVWLIVAGFLAVMYSQVRHEGPDMCGCDEHPANRANPGGICDSCWTRALDAGRCRLCGDADRADDDFELCTGCGDLVVERIGKEPL